MRKIAIVGPESTGKTTLTEQLALHFGEPWVREYAREYLASIDRPYQLEDLVTMAQEQVHLEQRAAAAADEWLFCDTNLLVIRIWARDKFGRIPEEVDALWEPKSFDLHLLLYPDLPWEEDPLREDPERLEELFGVYEQELESAGVSYAVIRGRGEERLERALWALDL